MADSERRSHTVYRSVTKAQTKREKSNQNPALLQRLKSRNNVLILQFLDSDSEDRKKDFQVNNSLLIDSKRFDFFSLRMPLSTSRATMTTKLLQAFSSGEEKLPKKQGT